MPRTLGARRQDDVGELYNRLVPSLYRYALMILANVFEAEDVVQQVFVALVRRGMLDVESADHYLRRAVRNECFSVLRRRKARPVDNVDAPLLEAVAAADDRPDERIAIERALRVLPPDQREVVHLKIFEGGTFQEIADVTDESINTIASRYRYAMEKLRTILGPAR